MAIDQVVLQPEQLIESPHGADLRFSVQAQSENRGGQCIRDEAHRFANEGHRKRRSKVGVASILDGVPGVGPSRRKRLLDRFGSLEDIRQATLEEIAAVPGIPYDVAESVKAFLD